ncbi:MAG TPA: HD domain-containing phosphohydrolase [Gemmatimonadales bacterium]|jgi:response regulator RpfG family c-di-GMP phosphodiesterase
MSEGIVVIADPDRGRRESLAFALEAHTNFRVEEVASPEAARPYLGVIDVAAIVCDARSDAQNNYDLLREVRNSPRCNHISFVLTGDCAAGWGRAAAWTHGVDAILNYPLDMAELVACVRHSRARRQARAWEVGKPADDHLAAHQTSLLLATLTDAAAPGLLSMTEEIVAVAQALAAEFDIAGGLLGDLHHAARLHQLARLIEPGTPWELPDPPTFSRLVASSARLVTEIPSLGTAAELIAGMAAHWDGSGIPSHMERGRIPMRSRILRATADFVRNRADHPSIAMDKISLYSGTLYDPAVVSALRGVVLARDPRAQTFRTETVAIDRLEPGLVLAVDLCSASGVKLLSAGAVLTSASLRMIRERHAADPIAHGIPTQRRLM